MPDTKTVAPAAAETKPAATPVAPAPAAPAAVVATPVAAAVVQEPPAEVDPDVTIKQSELTALLAFVKSRQKSTDVGAQARPNVKFRVLKTSIPADAFCPQIQQLVASIAATGKKVISEPELFAAIQAGAQAGVLKTRQHPVRILKYYMSDLRGAGILADAA